MADDVYYDPYDRQIRVDPYPTWCRMQDEAPVYYNEKYDFYAITRFEDTKQVFLDWESFSSKFGTVLELIDAGPENLPPLIPAFKDPPEHTAYRAIVARAFAPRRIRKIEDEIRQLTCDYLDAQVGKGGFDFSAEVAKRLPAHVIGMLLGVPEKDRDYLRQLAEALLHRDEGQEEWGYDAQEKIAEYLANHAQLRRENPAEDLTTTVVEADYNDPVTGETRKLNEVEVLGYLSLVIGAGNDTTTNLLTWMIYSLWKYPEQRQKLIEDPSLIPNAVEETLRFEGASPQQARVAMKDVEMHGVTIPKGAKVLVINGAAGRDKRVFDDPNKYLVDRKIFQTMSFGQGGHHCLGAALSRLEGRIVLEEMLKRFPDWKVDVENAEMKHTSTVRGWDILPIKY